MEVIPKEEFLDLEIRILTDIYGNEQESRPLLKLVK